MFGLFRRRKKEESAAPPQTYAQWSVMFDRLAAGDDDEACLAQLQCGDLSWTGGVAPLFVQRLTGEIQRRLDLCAKRLERDLRRGGGSETAVVRALLLARQQLGFVHRLCQLPCMPEATRGQLSAEVRKFAERSQQSLSDTAKSDRSGQLALWIRRNPLDAYPIDVARAGLAGPTPEPGCPTRAGVIPRRRQILQ